MMIWLFLLIQLSTIISAHNKIQLRDVNVLTLRKDQYTTARRVTPILQLNCVGGSAKSESHKVETVQCTNTGFDGKDYNWKCQSDLPSNLKLGKLSVSCEGYEYPNDPYVLVGSCGLKYNLEYETVNHNQHQNIPASNNQNTRTTTTTTFYNHRPFTYQHNSEASSFLVILFSSIFVLCFFCWIGSLFTSSTRIIHTPVVTPVITPVSRSVVTGPIDRYVTAQPIATNTYIVPQQSTTSAFVDGMILGSLTSRPTAHTHTHTTTTVDHTPSSNYSWGSSSDNSTHTSTSYGDTERR
jgi:SOCE-associated regulatory factor of calcium homoeostasis